MNFKNIMMLFTAVMFAGIACKKEADNPVTRVFNITGFTAVTAGDDHEIIITSGNNFSIKAKGGVDDINELRMQVAGGDLRIDYPVYRSNRKRVHIYITMPLISSFDFRGDCFGSVAGFQQAGVIGKLSGAADFSLDTDVNELNVFISGTSKLTAVGRAVKLNAESSGKAQYNGFAVKETAEAIVTTTGQARAYLSVSQILEADASGQSRIYYKGNPSAKNITQSGEAKVINE
ncbi:MAG: DUF2807 domain-containing protein [Ferruginibacter sp.]